MGTPQAYDILISLFTSSGAAVSAFEGTGNAGIQHLKRSRRYLEITDPGRNRKIELLLLRMGDEESVARAMQSFSADSQMIDAMGSYYEKFGKRPEVLGWLRKVCLYHIEYDRGPWLARLLGVWNAEWDHIQESRFRLEQVVELLYQFGDHDFLLEHAKAINSIVYIPELKSIVTSLLANLARMEQCL